MWYSYENIIVFYILCKNLHNTMQTQKDENYYELCSYFATLPIQLLHV